MLNTKKTIYCKNVLLCCICKRSYQTKNVRVRFAPSPTGFLHLGGLRTALYNSLFAKKHKGKFILRIEDTDQARLVPGAIEQLQDDLQWSGIEINEGPSQGGDFGPYLQSQRLKLYRDHVKLLLENGSAYHCFCTDRRLNLLKKEALKKQEIPKYDNRCRHLTPQEVQRNLDQGKPSCIRFKMSDQDESFNDLIYGRITCNLSLSEGDPVILKTDNYPTYHFANVVDDHLMEISHVLRGVEWQMSTTKHVLLYRAFNWTPPKFGHLPLLMNADGTKLSKRQGDIRINYYKECGIYPQALINFIVNSGGGFTKDSERHLKPQCYSMEELVGQFDVSRINSHSGKIMDERLLDYNKLEIERKLSNPDEIDQVIREVKNLLINTFPHKVQNKSLQYDNNHIKTTLKWAVPRINKLSDLVSTNMEFVWFIPFAEVKPAEIEIVKMLRTLLECDPNIAIDDLNQLLRMFCKQNNIGFGYFMKMLRYILSGLEEGPSIAEIISVLGMEKTLDRLDACINKSQT